MSKVTTITMKLVNESPWAKYVTFEDAKAAAGLALADVNADARALQASSSPTIKVTSFQGDTGNVNIAFNLRAIGGGVLNGDLAGILIEDGKYTLVGDFWGMRTREGFRSGTRADRFMNCLTSRLIQAGLAGYLKIPVETVAQLTKDAGLDIYDPLISNRLTIAQMIVGVYGVNRVPLPKALAIAQALDITSEQQAEQALKNLEPVTSPLATSQYVGIEDIQTLARSLGFVVDYGAICIEPRVAHLLPQVHLDGLMRLTYGGHQFVVQTNPEGNQNKYFLLGSKAGIESAKDAITQLALQTTMVNVMKASAGPNTNVVYKAWRDGPQIKFGYQSVNLADMPSYEEGETNATLAVARLNAA